MSSAHIFKSHKLHVKFTLSLVSTPFLKKRLGCLFVCFLGEGATSDLLVNGPSKQQEQRKHPCGPRRSPARVLHAKTFSIHCAELRHG